MKGIKSVYFNFTMTMLIMVISSCGMFRKVFKSKEYSKVEIYSKSAKDSSGFKVDKSVTTVKERVDTIVITQERVVKQETYLNMDSLVNGLTAVRNDLVDVRLVFNPVTGVLSTTATLKPQSIPVKIDKETVKQNDVIEQSLTNSSTEDKSQSIVDNSQIDKTPDLTWAYVIAGILLVIVILALVIKRRF